MASTAGVFNVRLRFAAVTPSRGTTTGNFNLALRFVSGIYNGAGVTNTTRRKTLFPRQDVAAIDPETGRFTEPWYRLLQFVYEQKLGGDLAPTLPQITDTVMATQTTTAAIAGTQTNIVQAIEANAASLAASNEVQISAGLPGAAQVPAPVLTVPPYTPRTNEAVT